MVESSVTPDPAYSEGRATLTPLSFSAAMDELAASMSKVNHMSGDDKKEPTVDELKAMLEKAGYQVTKPDPLAEAKVALEARNKEIETLKAEMEKLKAGAGQAPAPSSAPGKPAGQTPAATAGQEKKEDLTLEAQLKQDPRTCALEALKIAKQARNAPDWEKLYG
jgi:ribosomal protein L12E/L44/L45/RPP1/RPP2